MFEKTVISLYGKSFRFRLYMFFRRNNMFIGFPIITCYRSNFMMSYCFPKSLCRLVYIVGLYCKFLIPIKLQKSDSLKNYRIFGHRGSWRIRTAVDGFADRCLTARPRNLFCGCKVNTFIPF